MFNPIAHNLSTPIVYMRRSDLRRPDRKGPDAMTKRRLGADGEGTAVSPLFPSRGSSVAQAMP